MTIRAFLYRSAGVLVVLAAIPIGVEACSDDDVAAQLDAGSDAIAATDGATLDSSSLLDTGAELDAGAEAGDAAKPDARVTVTPCLTRLVGADAALVCGSGEVAWCDEACNAADGGLRCRPPTGDGLCHQSCGCDSDCTSPTFPKCTTTHFCKRSDVCYPLGLCRAADDDAGGLPFPGACLRDAASD